MRISITQDSRDLKEKNNVYLQFKSSMTFLDFHNPPPPPSLEKKPLNTVQFLHTNAFNAFNVLL